MMMMILLMLLLYIDVVVWGQGCGIQSQRSLPCEGISVTVEIQTDMNAYYDETSWKLSNLDTDETICEWNGKDYAIDEFTFDFCVQADTCYQFMISDSYGDGLSYGGYSLIVNGETIASGSDFGFSETTKFGCSTLPNSTNNPSIQPSSSSQLDRSARPSTSPTSCGTSAVIEISTGQFYKDNLWEIQSVSTDETAYIWNGKEYDALKDYRISLCLPDDCYRFTILDNDSDGGFDSYTLTVDDEVIASGSTFGSPEESFYFGCSFSPTSAPTITPTADYACDELSTTVEIHPENFLTDSYFWNIKDWNTGATIDSWYAFGSYGYYDYVNHRKNLCLSEEKCYKFTISDTDGEGLGDGRFTLTVDGVMISTGGNFGFEYSTRFGECPPTPSPTSYPTTYPSSYPSSSPTHLPSIPKSSYPSLYPSPNPTKAPSMRQTLPPSPTLKSSEPSQSKMSTTCTNSENSITIEVQTDAYPHESSWEIVNMYSGAVVESGGKYHSLPQYDKISKCLPQKCHRLTVYDTFGDGIDDPGYVRVFVNDEESAHITGLFGYSTSITVGCEEGVSVFSFYDNLRQDPTVSFASILSKSESNEELTGDDHIGRAAHRVSKITDSGEDTLILCHVPLFLQYPDDESDSIIQDDTRSIAYSSVAGMVLGINHWNEGDGSVVPDISGIPNSCPIRFTTEIVDMTTSDHSTTTAIRSITSTVSRLNSAITQPKPCSIIDASHLSMDLASMSNSYDLFHVSTSSSSMTNTDQRQRSAINSGAYTQMRPSDGDIAIQSVNYLNQIVNVTRFALVYNPDHHQSVRFHNSVLKQAEKLGISVMLIPIQLNPRMSVEEIEERFINLKKYKFSAILAMFHHEQYKNIMMAAANMKVAGPLHGYFWVFAGDSFIIDSTETRSESANYLKGNVIIQDSIIKSQGAIQKTDRDGHQVNRNKDTFSEVWTKFGSSEDSLSYLQSKQPFVTSHPINADFFRKTPSKVARYTYDAILGMGLSACHLWSANTDDGETELFSGIDHASIFMNTSFAGASGNVAFDKSSLNRKESTSSYSASFIDRTGTTHYFDPEEQIWKTIDIGSHIFQDDHLSLKILSEVLENVDTSTPQPKHHFLKKGVRVLCFILFLLGLATTVLMLFKRCDINHPLKSLHHLMVCGGNIMMSLAIVPFLTSDEKDLQEGSSVYENNSRLNASCSVTLWFVLIGFTITLSSIFCKLWSTYKLSKAVKKFRSSMRKESSPNRLLAAVTTALVSTNIIILICWQIISPIRWKREVILEFDVILETIGQCQSTSWKPYVALLIVINGIILLTTVYVGFKSRNILPRLSESYSFFMAATAILEIIFIGVPLLFSGFDPSTFTFIACAMIFFIAKSVELFIFVPELVLSEDKRKSSKYRSHHSSSSGSRSIQNHYSEEWNSSAHTESGGYKMFKRLFSRQD